MQSNPYRPTTKEEEKNVNQGLGVAAPMQPIAFYTAGITIVFGTYLILPLAKSIYLFLFMFAFVFGPLVLAMLPMWFFRNLKSQLILVFAAIAYAVWFTLVYLHVESARNAMAAVLFFYVGPIASPFLFVICGISLPFHLRRNRH